MRKVLLVHISSSGCCNTLVTMLNNGDFGFPYCATPAFSTPTVWCRVFQSRVFQSRVFSRPRQLLVDIVGCHFDVIVSTDNDAPCDAAMNARGIRVRVRLSVVNVLHVIVARAQFLRYRM